MVQSFWLYCHFWDLSRISPCVSFLSSLLTSTHDTQRTDNFIVSSRSIWNQRVTTFQCYKTKITIRCIGILPRLCWKIIFQIKSE
jgi:hypothetical protein